MWVEAGQPCFKNNGVGGIDGGVRGKRVGDEAGGSRVEDLM
jgi:hypothetical protein